MRTCHTLVIGSGAAGLSAAVQLHRLGVEDVLIVTEGLDQGTSINTGSDKQTYYKLAMCATASDSPHELAETFFAGGSMHGDLALAEAANSARAFLNLVTLGVPFPRDRYGQFVGYKTDHDPRQRATSVGPYTSRDMCRALIAEATRLGIMILERHIAVSLVTLPHPEPDRPRRAVGAVVMDSFGNTDAILAENIVFAVGGPGGLYQTSVYPVGHTGGIGLALEAGALAQSLPESQYGLASTAFRWNVSGTYMQVIPKVVSTAADGTSDPREFLLPWFDTPTEAFSRVFLKGYQWPFDTRKLVGGSSLIDILVYIETVTRSRRVFLDYRTNATGFDPQALSEEARSYLEKSHALAGTPFDRLHTMNPGAIALYYEHNIDLATEPLEIAVCAQHNNGGLASDSWWESLNIRSLFPIGEVNGSHGITRPGGSALNAGQVGAIRAAEQIAATRRTPTLDHTAAQAAAKEQVATLEAWLNRTDDIAASWIDERKQLQERMSRAGAHIRSRDAVIAARDEARAQVIRLQTNGCRHTGSASRAEALRTRSLAIAQVAYLDAIAFQLDSGAGSRGSAMVQDATATPIHPRLTADWAFVPENPAFREKVLETRPTANDTFSHRWVPCRPIPESDTWFETAWAAFRNGEIYRE